MDEVNISNVPLISLEEQERTYRKVFWSHLVTRAFIVYVVVASTLSSAILLFLAFQDHSRIQQNNEIQTFIKAQAIENGKLSRRNAELLKEVRSCTQPTGACHQRGDRATANAINSINLVSMLAIACSQGETGTVDQVVKKIQVCVTEKLGVR